MRWCTCNKFVGLIIYSVNISLLCMIKVRVRWCTCSEFIGLLLFRLLLLFLLSILFFKYNVRTYKKYKE